MSESSKRTPDELLEALNRTTKSECGKLRVFLGMCPGVGKTYAMLEAARLQQLRGVNVKVGVVETHGRKETEELLEGLYLIPKKEILYKDTKLLEMDLDKILNEKPELVLVDELAHTNAPGARHAKRYQDVQEIIDAGIDVYTTVNVQHIESRNDQVAQITGIIVRETVPDSLLELADQVEVIDLSPAELLKRMSEGKVYLGDRAIRAQEGFFKEEHLLALRELALRYVAEKVDQDLLDHMTIKGIEGPWNTNERLLVAVSHSPSSARLIRTTKRMAYNLEAPWIALYVNTGEMLTDTDTLMLQKNINLARELGAEVVTHADADIAFAIKKVSHDRNVTQIIIGRPDRRAILDFFTQGTLLDKLVRETSKVDIHVIRAERKPRFKGIKLKWPKIKTDIFPYYYTALFMFLISIIARSVFNIIGYRALGSLFLLAILVVSSFASAGPILFAALISAFIWNFFFIPPEFTFLITSSEDIMMVISFFFAATVGGFLTSRIRKNEAILKRRENETRLLYQLTKKLSEIQNAGDAANILSETIKSHFKAQSIILLESQNRKLMVANKIRGQIDEKDLAVAQWTFENEKSAGWSTQTLSASNCLCLPIKGNTGTLGVVVFLPENKKSILNVETEIFLGTIITQTGIVLERLEFRKGAEATKLYEASEKLHEILLNSVSHELRTPITALIGLASALKNEKTLDDKKARKTLTDDLIAASKRLDRVVENLLDVSRIEKGSLQLKNEWFEIGELIERIKENLKEELAGKELNIIGAKESLIEGDFQLLEHVFTQLIFNAIKYSKADTSIDVEIKIHHSQLKVFIRDYGIGIPAGFETQIFEKFFRVPGTPAGGIGLGLSIVKSIIELHNGQVLARNRSDVNGAEFEVILPLKSTPPILNEMVFPY